MGQKCPLEGGGREVDGVASGLGSCLQGCTNYVN